MYLCSVLDISILPLSTILIFAFGIVLTVWDFFFFNFIHTSHFLLHLESEQVFYSFCVCYFFLSDGKSKSNKESILRNWKTLTQSIDATDFERKLVTCNFLPHSSFVDLENKNRLYLATLILIKVYRQVQSSEKEYRKFVKILGRCHSTTANVLNKHVDGPINNPVTGM